MPLRLYEKNSVLTNKIMNMRRNFNKIFVGAIFAATLFGVTSCSEKDILNDSNTTNMMLTKAMPTSDFYYWYKGEKVGISSLANTFYVSCSDSVKLQNLFKNNSAISSNTTLFSSIDKAQKKHYWRIMKTSSAVSSTANMLKELKTMIGDESITIAPVFGDDKNMIPTCEYFYVRLKNQNDYSLLQNIAKQYSASILGEVDYMPNWYELKSPASSNGLEMSNKFYETNLFEAVDPNFMFNFAPNSCVSDPLADQQWALNTVDACDAWKITKGKGVTVAVLDQGIDSKHKEFSNNYSTLSYDLLTKSSPTQVYGNHGTHVAGIIGANHNGIQIAGLAPEVSLVSLNHPLNVGYTDAIAQLASGFGYATSHGIDVINNSWGDQGGELYGYMHSTLLEEGIQNALINGRNGKGMVVVFASGNKRMNRTDYPGNMFPEVLVVGSISSNLKRADYSSYGDKLDVMAPGSDILSTMPGNSTGKMSGTSMAAPYAAALAALVLSVNPSLTNLDVCRIIEQTAQKGGGYTYSSVSGKNNGTYNNEMGYGIINAPKAIRLAKEGIDKINFIDKTVSSNQTISGYDIYTKNIIVTNNSLLKFILSNEINIDKPFVVNRGSQIEISF